MTSLTKQGFNEKSVQQLSRSAGEPEWILRRRLKALKQFDSLPMPHSKMEEWRYTDISDLDLADFPPTSRDEAGQEPPAKRADFFREVTDCPALIQSGSKTLELRLPKEVEKKGVVFTDIWTAMEEHPDLVREHFMTRMVLSERDKFTALHGAFWSGGIFVYVPRDVKVRLPLRSLLWSDGGQRGHFNHTLVIAEPFSEVLLFEEVGSPGGNGERLYSDVTEVFVKDHAQVEYLTLQNLATNSYCFSTKRASVGRDANMTWLIGTFGSKLCKVTVDNVFEEQGAEGENMGLFFGRGKQHLDISSNAIHLAPNTGSDMLTKGALKDTASSIYTGLIRIEQNAKQSLSFLSENTLLLSDNARANAKPNLEIDTNDVQASHGATVGRLDDEQLFYLMSRGLPRDLAETLVVEGFFVPVLDRIEDKAIAERYGRLIAERTSAAFAE